MDNAARAARAADDSHGVDPVVTGDSDLADWAKRHGYRVQVVDRDEATIYEIRPADVDSGSDPEP